jgi:ATP-dependent RNA helicase HelY
VSRPASTAGDLLERFAATYAFPLDDFQVAGITALAEARSVLVAAPTGAGKTVVGEFAVWHALAHGRKCFYTTPIKALSNQKFHDLRALHGTARVGLLTGDNAINGEAPIVVMTTEVLRNMLYEDAPVLGGLESVVLDEVHYLADPERGAVWEEVIIQLSADVQLACLSATVSNAEEFGAWIKQVRASCDVVITDRRPVPLEHHYAIGERILPVFAAGAGKTGKKDPGKARAARQAKSGVPNPEVVMLERRAGGGGRPARKGRRYQTGVRLRPPRRSEVVGELARRRWLPAIYFVFSRSGCDQAVGHLGADGVVLTSREERRQIRAVVEKRVADVAAADLEVLGYGPWLDGLLRGVAAHHAGMVPLFKETVEALFVDGLLKVCFATETLALGINMPARTVVIERLEKWDGQRHALLTPGQFTQLTGRAGRRGLDALGHALVLYQRDIDFPTVASLVGRRVEPLRSSFAPSYNMAVNLLRRHDRPEAERLLARSFAQYQADATVADDEERVARNRQALAGYRRNLTSDLGDFGEYWSLRRALSRRESAAAAERRQRKGEAVHRALEGLREGDVVALPHGRGRADRAAIVGRTTGRDGTPLASAVTEDRRLVRIGPREFDAPPVRVGRVRLPGRGGPRQAAYRKQVAAQVRGIDLPPGAGQRDATAPDRALREEIETLRERVRGHPVHRDPRLAEIEVWAHRTDDLEAETDKLERRVRRRSGSLVREFDRLVALLGDLGYLAARDDPEPTPLGLVLAGLYAETDLLLVECLRRGVLANLDPPDLAAVASVFVHETRMKEPPPPVFPTRRVREVVEAVGTVHRDLVALEEQGGVAPTRPPDAGFCDVVWRWAAGAELDDALEGSELTAGDFVRSVKQVADLLRQLRDSAASMGIDGTAHTAQKALIRGVVAFSGA